jgi:uroporphyrinogen decarboxylase
MNSLKGETAPVIASPGDPSSEGSSKSLLRALAGEPMWPPPIWLMRQAGRYLPEYRELRAKAGSFLDLCYTPALAAEVTLQPIRRFGFDGAILFSDILVVPHALGQDVRFVEGEGPRLDPVTTAAELSRLAEELPLERLGPVFETLERVRGALPARTTLLGFCGAPWTVASYMVGGRGTPDLAPVRQAAASDPAFLEGLIDRLVEASTAYLVRQLEAGAEAVQIFESHAGVLRGADLERWSFRPIRRIVEGVRARRPGARVIVFARGAGEAHAEVGPATGASAIGLDQGVDLPALLPTLPPKLPTQGNLDPETLFAGSEALDRAVDAILSAVRGRPHVFNLGHGIVPPTPIPHVERMVARVRAAAGP